MRGTSSEYDDIVRTDHGQAVQADQVRGGQVVEQLEVTGGTGITADRQGAQLRSLRLETTIPDTKVTVFGSRIQMYGGVVKPKTGLHEQVNDAVHGWDGWDLDGLKVDGTGALVIGP